MREIKFRAWDDDIKAMRHYDFLFTSQVKEFGGCDWTIDKLMQFTGLLDKNGKEIYEGDIVRGILNYPSSEFLETDAKLVDETGDVQWKELTWMLCHKEKDEYAGGVIDRYDSIEIIGNIYENPELLKDSAHSENQSS